MSKSPKIPNVFTSANFPCLSFSRNDCMSPSLASSILNWPTCLTPFLLRLSLLFPLPLQNRSKVLKNAACQPSHQPQRPLFLPLLGQSKSPFHTHHHGLNLY